jgi:BlaI family transcriptional regulator, penicillinase repressor
MEKLTLQEEEAMQALWEIQEGNVKAIQDAIHDTALPYTTLASTIKNLERKGFVGATKIGNTYIYKPLIAESQYKKKHLQSFISNYFDNSYKNMVSFFVKEKKLSAKDLQDIIKQIENNK